MSDPKLVEEVLGEEWTAARFVVVIGDEGRIAEFTTPFFPGSKASMRLTNEERARQAALGHRLLKVVANARNDELSTDDWVRVDAIIAELRGGK